MSSYTGPEITNDGLILCLDAGNAKSYPGTGSTWTDLSGNGNTGTLVNEPTFSTSNGGIISFNGIDEYATVSLNLTNTTYSVMAIAKRTSNGRVISSNSTNWLMGWWQTQTDKYYAEGWVSSSSGGATDTNWICYVATGNYSGDSWALYKNGSLIVGPNANGANGPNGIRIGSDGLYNEYSACQVSCVLAYNRVLTAAEVQQNFNAFRGRYGI